jgi:long-chain acyl-CoA synthetase
VWEFYGSTEGQFTVCSPDEWVARPGTVGRPRPGRRLSVDDDGTIWCEAPGFARFEYWRDPDATARARRGGSFTVGDVGRLDDDGYLYLEGRRDDLVITGGVNVYPAEVEAVLAEVLGVSEVAVFGIPDAEWGERVCAAVVGSADQQALSEHARARLAPFKRPKQYFSLAELPRTATGKLRRRALPTSVGLETEGPMGDHAGSRTPTGRRDQSGG